MISDPFFKKSSHIFLRYFQISKKLFFPHFLGKYEPKTQASKVLGYL